MFSQFLISRFVKDYKNTKSKKVRESYGILGGVVGVILNIILFAVKITVGLIAGSIAVTADAFNNLSDVASSVITIFGFKIASKPADKEHPFGHGRVEYISALVVSFLVMMVGFQFVKSSFDRIIHPEPLNFELIPFLLLVFSVLAKIWISKFNIFLGKTINSSTLKASGYDAFSDVIASSCVALSLLLSLFISFPIDGYMGILVALFILYSGFSLIKETLNPLLGELPDPELVEEINKSVLSYEYISGVHDLIVHNYGPGRVMASIHAEVPADISIAKIHEIIDQAEKEISKNLNLFLVIHMDPINTDCEEVAADKQFLMEALKAFPIVKSIHDFRVVGEDEQKNLIFDIVVDSSKRLSQTDEDALMEDIEKKVKETHPKYNTIITLDRDFSAL